MIGHFVKLCKRKGLKVDGDEIKVIGKGGEEESVCEVSVEGKQLKHVFGFF